MSAQLRERLAGVRGGGDDAARECRVERGKVLVREREDRLRDPSRHRRKAPGRAGRITRQPPSNATVGV
jgi:hypothetical protein